MRPRHLLLLLLLGLVALTQAGLDTAPPPPPTAQMVADPRPRPAPRASALHIGAKPGPLPPPSPSFEPDLGPDEVVRAAFDGRYPALTQRLRADPGRLARLAHAELQAASETDLHSVRSRVLIHALGEVADPESATILAELIDRPLPLADPTQHHFEPRAEANITRGLALEALAKVARASPEAAQILDDTLQRIIERRQSHHLVAEAVTQLRLRGGDSDSTRAELEARLGPELRHLAHLELRNTLPPTPEGN